jgi:hypothetical protein
MTRVYKPSLEIIAFLFVFPLILLDFDDSELLRLLHMFDDDFQSFGMFGLEDQSQTMSEAVTPFPE